MARRKPSVAASPWPAPASGDAPAASGASGPDPRLAVIVSHTHWDREWYQPFRRFRVHLVEVVRQVLDALERGGEFRHFLLDGQAIVLEDHLAIRPEDEPRIGVLVRAGKLSIGPWYVLPDWFLVSG